MPDIPEGFEPYDAAPPKTAAPAIPEGFAPKEDDAIPEGFESTDYTPEDRRLAASGAITNLPDGAKITEMLKPHLGPYATVVGQMWNAVPLMAGILGLGGGRAEGSIAEEAAAPFTGLTAAEKASVTEAERVPSGYLEGPSAQPAPENAPAPAAEPAPSPAAKEVLDVPAIRTKGGQIVTGERGMEHKDIIAQTPNLPAPVEHGFIDRNGQFVTRPQARAIVNAATGAKLGAGEPDSRQLFPEPQKQLPGPPAEATRYHGTSTPIDVLRPDTYSTQNIYGQGFYTTDDYDIAKGYSRKGKGGRPSVYNVAEKPGQNLLNLDAVPPPAVRAVIDKMSDLPGPEGELGAYFQENPGATVRDWYDDMRGLATEGGGYNADDVQGAFASMQQNLEEMGYHGLTHVGGRNTGKPPHAVNIYFNPSASLDVEGTKPWTPENPSESQLQRAIGLAQPSAAIPEDFEPVDAPPPKPVPRQYPRSKVFDIPPKDVKLDPQTFQYKIQVDPKTGTGKSLSGIKNYNEAYSGIEEFWYDEDSGQLYVSHGHHRHNAALRSDAPTVRGVILDSGSSHPDAVAQNITKEMARSRGALINFADQKGTPVDAANYLRSNPDITPDKLHGLDVDISGAELIHQALGLRHLSNPIWHDVAIGKLKPEIGSIIGEQFPGDDREQIETYKTVKEMEEKGRPFTGDRLTNYIKLRKGAEQAKIEEAKGIGSTKSMFGDAPIVRSTFQEQSDILTDVTRRLKTEGNQFGSVARNKQRLEKANNVIDAETSAKMSEQARTVGNVVDTFGVAPGTNVNNVLREYAVKLAQSPASRKQILEEAFNAMLEAAEKDSPSGAAVPEDDKTGKLF